MYRFHQPGHAYAVVHVCYIRLFNDNEITLRVAWHEFVPAEGKITEEGISEH